MNRWLGVLAAAGPTIFAGGAHALDCNITMDSMIASAKVPYEETISTVVGPNIPPTVSRVIWTTKESFVQSNGKWQKVRTTMQDLMDKYNEIKKEAKISCQQLADESINGEPANVYAAQVDYLDTIQKNKLWLSKKTGLPLESVDDQGDDTVITITWDYKNVTAPAGVQ
jgi:hypothetical protein